MARDVAKPMRAGSRTGYNRNRIRTVINASQMPSPSVVIRCQFNRTHVSIRCKMDDEKLFELIRKYEFLYNLQHLKHMDTTKKEMAWKEISEELKQSACKQRWQGLRDAY
ncbi:hypothetical protein ACJJTC_017266 [Scirpophaga incertulas]